MGCQEEIRRCNWLVLTLTLALVTMFALAVWAGYKYDQLVFECATCIKAEL